MERINELFNEMKERFWEFKSKYETLDTASLEKDLNIVEVFFRWGSYLLWLFIIFFFPAYQVKVTGNWLWWFSIFFSPFLGFFGFVVIGVINVTFENFYLWFRSKRRG